MTGMIVIAIVNIISALTVIIGGYCMKSVSEAPGDHTIGYRTKRSCLNDENWKYANSTCAKLWIYTGAAATILSVCGIILGSFSVAAGSIMQFAVLTAMTASLILSAVIIEAELKKRQ